MPVSTKAQRFQLFFRLLVDVGKVRTLHRFQVGVHDLPVDLVRRLCIPHRELYCDMCGSGLGDKHHFVFTYPALTPLGERNAHMFTNSSRSFRRFIWQDVLCSVVNFICDALNPAEGSAAVIDLGGVVGDCHSYYSLRLRRFKACQLSLSGSAMSPRTSSHALWAEQMQFFVLYENGIPKTTHGKISPQSVHATSFILMSGLSGDVHTILNWPV